MAISSRSRKRVSGGGTRFGGIAAALRSDEPPTAFERGLHALGVLILRMTAFLVLFVLLANLMLHRPALESFLFAIALAVGLTPEPVEICGGIQGYQVFVGDLRGTGALEWPVRVLLVIGGFVVATPGGGIMPLSQIQVTMLGLAILIPTALVAMVLIRRRSPMANQLHAP